MKDRLKHLSKKDRQMAEQFGGVTPKDWENYQAYINRLGCDKGGHKERSRHNDDGQHDRHWFDLIKLGRY